MAVEAEGDEVVVSQTRRPTKPGPGLAPSTLTFLQVIGPDAICIIGGARELFSAQSHLHALGRISTLRNLQNSEKLTNSAEMMTILKLFKDCCMTMM